MMSQTTFTLLVLALSVLAGACDASFQPFAESDRYFTVMGYLDSDADTQFVRIVPLRQVLDRSQPLPIDVTVQTTDLGTGVQVAWHDSLFQFTDSTYGHVFWAVFHPQPEHRYRIEVQRSDGSTTTAETTLPPAPDTSLTHSVENRGAFFQPLIWPGVTNVIDLDVRYRVGASSGAPPTFTVSDVFIRYEDDDRGSLQGHEWWAEFQLSEDYPHILRALNATQDQRIRLYSLTMRIAVPSEDWHPPGGLWDPEVLVQPGTFSNVTNGLGFWGSVTRVTSQHHLNRPALDVFNFEPYFGP